MLLHDIGSRLSGKQMRMEEIISRCMGLREKRWLHRSLRRLKFDNDTIRKVTRLVKWHDDRPEGMTKAVQQGSEPYR